MKVFVAGASGALGKLLIPQLEAKGHEVVGMTRTPAKSDALRALGARPVVADALDADAVHKAVVDAEPEVIVHQLTALSGDMDMRHPDRFFAMTNRLRTEGTDHLLAAGQAAGARRFVAQSYAGWPYARTGGPVKTEDDPLDPDPPKSLRTSLDAIRYLEDRVTGIDWGEGIVLRYGGFYGPGTGMSADPDAPMTKPIRKRQFPIMDGGGGIWSFIHIEDAATATLIAATEHASPGIYNIVDDEPAPVRVWLPELAKALGAKRPMKVPKFIGRLVAGEAAVALMTEIRGASNAKAKDQLGWVLRYPTWRLGFEKGMD
jgi:nucleoside-diphosphate-sugar epimerase